ncbi:MAG: bifunctional 3'-5' exonuclease/DNA polymerase, partial [Microbacterium sp.]|nr:bifunctional 3'-5' exonuclease/DNA polymerase [Microbacterium sp.]
MSVALDADGAEIERRSFDDDALPGEIRRVEDAGGPGPRWVWSDTPEWYERLLDVGVRVARCHDLRLCHAILRDSRLVADAAALRAATAWDAAASVEPARDDQALFALEDESPARRVGPPSVAAALKEFARQRDAIRAAADPGRLRLLCSAESAGALIASELRHAGLPWDAAVHDRI